MLPTRRQTPSTPDYSSSDLTDADSSSGSAAIGGATVANRAANQAGALTRRGKWCKRAPICVGLWLPGVGAGLGKVGPVVWSTPSAPPPRGRCSG